MAAFDQHVLAPRHAMDGRAEEAMISTAVTDLEAIYRDHHTRVLRLAYRITGSLSDAEDVVQTVFLRLARRDFRSEQVSELAAYLNRAAANAALDVLRARRDARAVPLDEAAPLPTRSASPERQRAGSELREWLRGALVGLNPKAAEMFVLRYVEEYSNSEIARAMNTSSAVVAVLLHRARARLRRELRAFAGD